MVWTSNVFWSCSPRLAAKDNRTEQWPANNLALIHAVAAYLEAFQITHRAAYLTKGEALLDYLLLFQQSWTNPVLENLSSPVMLLGGFTTQNSDGEWSDARKVFGRSDPELLPGYRKSRIFGTSRRSIACPVSYLAIRKLGPHRLRPQSRDQQLSLGHG